MGQIIVRARSGDAGRARALERLVPVDVPV
jgi:hypothetical protein